jgi:leucyl aminopeptidase
VRSLCGTTIEVVDTDAEGRMLLADTLTLASRKTIPSAATSFVNSRVRQPRMVIDFATLTGSCIAATTNRYISLFTNRPGLIPTLLQASHRSGERAWPFPLDPIFHEDLKSDIADLMQVLYYCCTDLDNLLSHSLFLNSVVQVEKLIISMQQPF